jgi:hypothetical protein
MKINYKKVKYLVMPHCGKCGEILKDNGSGIECSCGVWEYDYILKEFKPTSIPRKLETKK